MFGHDDQQPGQQVNGQMQQSVGGLGTPPPLADPSTPLLPEEGTPDPMPPQDQSNASSFDSGPMTSDQSSSDDNGLMDIKAQALSQLSPLLGHLDQSPEEKFMTSMMLIQAGDKSELIPESYNAAQQIPDEKVKAQALLDIVNEINYFTQHQ
jgi:hypothetical protein